MRKPEVQIGNSCLHKRLDITERTWMMQSKATVCIMSASWEPRGNSGIRLLNKEGRPTSEALEEGAVPSREHSALSHIPDTEWKSKRAKGRVVCGWQSAANI